MTFTEKATSLDIIWEALEGGNLPFIPPWVFAKLLQSCLTLQPHGLWSARLHGILQARILRWTAIPLSVHIYRKHKFWLMQATHLQTLEDVTFPEQTISNRSFDVQWSSLVWWSICHRRKQRDCKPNIHRSHCGWSWDCTSGIWRGVMVVWGLPRRR